MRGGRDVTDDELASTGVVLCEASSISDIGADIALNGNFVKLVMWYNNEWGYSNECADSAIYMQSIDG